MHETARAYAPARGCVRAWHLPGYAVYWPMCVLAAFGATRHVVNSASCSRKAADGSLSPLWAGGTY